MTTNLALHSNSIREHIHTLIRAIIPYDDVEQEHINDTCLWIESGEPIFRVQKPDVPNKHLVSYFVLFDDVHQKILLVDHKKALLWLPSGGHVEIDEDPKTTVERECLEELNVTADFWSPHPLFLTSTVTVGLTAGHTDVSLWYVLKGDVIKLMNLIKRNSMTSVGFILMRCLTQSQILIWNVLYKNSKVIYEKSYSQKGKNC